MSSKKGKPQQSAAPLTPPTAEQIRAILEKDDDFGHELRVGHVIASLGKFEAEHGGTYKDPITGKPRQFDFRVKFSGRRHHNNRVVRIAIECKNLSQLSALVVSGVPRAAHESFHQLIESQTTHEGAFPAAKFSRCSNPAFYEAGKLVGKSLIHIKYNKEDVLVGGADVDIYEKWSQALASAVGLGEMACADPGTTSAILPAVVVPDGTLWAALYDEGLGKLIGEPAPTNEVEFFLGHPIQILPDQPQFVISHIHFVTLGGLAQFLGRVSFQHFETLTIPDIT